MYQISRLKCRYRATLIRHLVAGFAVVAALVSPVRIQADTFSLSDFQVQNFDADGSVTVAPSGFSFSLTGGNTGSGVAGETDFTNTASASTTIPFDWSYTSADFPGYDFAGYLINTVHIQLADTDGQSGSASFSVSPGDVYGWYVGTVDNQGEPGILNVSITAAQVPEPRYSLLIALGLVLLAAKSRYCRAGAGVLTIAFFAAHGANAQSQNHYIGTPITGQLTLVRVVNPSQIASSGMSGAQALNEAGMRMHAESVRGRRTGPEMPLFSAPTHRPLMLGAISSAVAMPAVQSLPVLSGGSPSGFAGMTHYDQRYADSGNQFSVEPPNPAIAVANGFVLEGVNNAVRVYNQSGSPLLPVLSSDQWFGLGTEYNRTTGFNGVYPTDMRVYFDSDISRWFVLQRALDNDAFGNSLPTSHLYLAVSATSDPTGAWNIYIMDTTDAKNPKCPCLADYPQIGSDQYGIYITADEYDTTFFEAVDSIVLAISKSALASSSAVPPVVQFNLPFNTGFEFALKPATTPPGSAKFIASGGVEYFVSSDAQGALSSQLAIWAMSNTASLASSPSPILTQTLVNTEWYAYPDVATQRPGPLPYGSTLFPPGQLELIDGGPDSRVQSVSYAGGRLYVTLPAQVIDDSGNSVVGGAYMILSPTFRNNLLGGTVLQQGYLSVTGNHILRPAIAVNAQGRGAISFTLVGPDYFPTAAFTLISLNTPPGAVQIAAAGAGPEDGFTGYGQSAPVARWGDFSSAWATSDGSIWMATEYIPQVLTPANLNPANWGTYIWRYVP